MNKFKKILIYESFLILLFFLTYCNEIKKDQVKSGTNESEYTLGNAYLDVNGLEEAKQHFEKGLLLLHSFEYWDAADAFLAAQKIDPDLVMAYWGEAMTYNHGLWRGQDYEKGVDALKKLGESQEIRLGKAKSTLEKDLLESVEILYGEGTKFERDQAYSSFMGKLYKKYPENHEVAAFYALSLLGSVKEGRDEDIYEKGAIVAQGILKENPGHPGALHYLIHSYDDPYNAFKALEAADSYSEVAKDAAHALHMPSHIYVAMGMWNKVVSSNEISYQASVNRMERKGLDNKARGYHYFYWLMYGYLQQGKFDKAQDMMKQMQEFSKDPPTTGARSYMIQMTATYLVETDRWEDASIRDHEVSLENLNISARTLYAFLRGMAQLKNGDIPGVESTIESMQDDRKLAIGRMENRAVAGCGGSWKYEFPNQVDINQAEVMQLELSALVENAKENLPEAEELIKKAVALEENTSYSFGPPTVAIPSYELYGKWLLDQNRPEEAISAYEKALERGPNRILALKGLKSAYDATNNTEKSSEIEAKILEFQKAGQST